MPKNGPAIYDTDERGKQYRTELREFAMKENTRLHAAIRRMHTEFEKVRAITKPAMRQGALDGLKKDLSSDAPLEEEDDDEDPEKFSLATRNTPVILGDIRLDPDARRSMSPSTKRVSLLSMRVSDPFETYDQPRPPAAAVRRSSHQSRRNSLENESPRRHSCPLEDVVPARRSSNVFGRHRGQYHSNESEMKTEGVHSTMNQNLSSSTSASAWKKIPDLVARLPRRNSREFEDLLSVARPKSRSWMVPRKLESIPEMKSMDSTDVSRK